MHRLSTRLALAFALTSLVGIGLAALFVRQLVTTQFNSFVVEQRRAEFVSAAANYYAANESWAGMSPQALFRSYGRPWGGGQGGGPNDSPPVSFALVDQSGTIVMSPDPEQRGTPADPQRLAEGTPVSVDGQVVGRVYLVSTPGRSPDEERHLARTDQALAAAALVAVLIALALGMLLARLITRPVRDLTRAVEAISIGKLGQQVPVRSRDELGLLARQFNQMSADLQRATELRRRMTADIAHDLRTPLTVISGYLEALRDESLRPTAARFAAMHDETQVLLHLVTDLHTLSLADAGELALHLEPVAPRQLLDRAAATFQHATSQSEVALIVTPSPSLPPLLGDPEQLLRVLHNLMGNALRYTPPGGRIALEASATESAVTLTVSDTGSGIPAKDLPNIFERFYRADQSRQQATGGSGLGLAIVRSIVEAHAGTIAVQSVLGQGTTFTICLPCASGSQPDMHPEKLSLANHSCDNE